MNYFAHGRAYVADPYFLAGTAIPDWLSIIDRQVRVRAKSAQRFVDDPDPQVAALAQGAVQHLTDDNWFHQTPAFHELNVQFTGLVRLALEGDDGYRPAFLGHILVELLLDAVLIEQQPHLLDGYYEALAAVDPQVVERAVNSMASQPTDRLATLLPRFISERFLYDYAHDGKLLQRLNQVMRRTKLPEIPARLLSILPQARELVARRHLELLDPTSQIS